MGYQLAVDLGTTFTSAAVHRDGSVEAVQLGDHSAQIPSLVYLRRDGQLLIGEAAARRASEDPTRLAREFKRRVGDPVELALGPATFSPESLMARLLRWVVQTVTRLEGSEPDSIVVAHPATWGPHRRKMLDDVIRLADIPSATTCTEPLAAAIHFASTERVDKDDVVAVYDLGGGTFDAAILRKTEGGFTPLGIPQGLDDLGGADFNHEVFEYALAALEREFLNLLPDDPSTLAALYRLQSDSTAAKEALSADTDAVITVSWGGQDTKVRLTRSEFEDMVRPALMRTVECLRQAMTSAGVDQQRLKAVVLIGGSARIPLVSELLSHEFQRPIVIDSQPKLAVALGAARLIGVSTSRAPAAAPRPSKADRTAEASSVAVATSRSADQVATVTMPRVASTPRFDVPRERWVPACAAAVALVAAVLLAWIGAGAAGSGAGTVQIGGRSVGWGESAPIDLAGFAMPAGSSLSATLDVLGVSKTWDAAGTAADESFDPYVGLLLAGPVRGKVDPQQFPVRVVPQRSFITTIPGMLMVVLVLFVGGYTWLIVRQVRRRRAAARSDYYSIAGIGALAGVILVAMAWMIGQRLPPDGNWLSIVRVLAVLMAGAVAAVAMLRALAVDQ